MKGKTIIIAVSLVVVIIGATVLYGALRDKAGVTDLPMLNQNGQQNNKTGESASEGQQLGTTQDSQNDQSGNPGNQENQGGPQQNEGEDESGTPPTDGQQDDILAPDFTVQDADGNDVKLSDMRGKPTIVNFWASWCPPCKGEMPEFNKVFEELGEEINFMMVCLTDGERETKRTGAAFIKESGYSFPIYFDITMEAAITYEVRSIPSTYFIDAKGNMITYAVGAINEETLRVGIDMIK